MNFVFPIALLAALGAVPAQPGSWKEGARMPAARSESRAAVIGGLIYFPAGFGGVNHLAAYDPAADKWTTLKTMPVGLDHPMVEAFGGKLYVMKGRTWAYAPATDTWEEKKAGRYFRSDGTAVAFGEHIYVIGGQGVRPIERYSPATDAWEELSSMPTERGHVQAVVLGGKIWVVGGRAGNRMHKTVDIYDPAAGTWSAGPEMGEAHTGHAAAVVGGRLIVAGGEVQAAGGPAIVKSVEIYDPAAGRWAFAGDMPTPLHGVASVAYGGKMYVMGGSYRAYAAVNSDQVFLYEPPAPGTPVRAAPAERGKAAAPGGPGRPAARRVWKRDADGSIYDALGAALRPDRYSGAR